MSSTAVYQDEKLDKSLAFFQKVAYHISIHQLGSVSFDNLIFLRSCNAIKVIDITLRISK